MVSLDREKNFHWLQKFVNTIKAFSNDKALHYLIQPILFPQTAFISHWVGLVVSKNSDNILTITYLDSENQPAPLMVQNTLLALLQNSFPDKKNIFEQPVLETQCYNNCGPELVENFIYHLTRTRVTQEAAVYLHSLLYENSLLNPEISGP